MQVYPIKPKLKLPGTKRLKPKCDEPLSKFTFKFKLRRYTKGRVTKTPSQAAATVLAGAYTPPPFGST